MADFDSHAKKGLHHIIFFGFVSSQKGCVEHSGDVKMQQFTWKGVDPL